METPPKHYYFEELTGYVYSDLDEAQNQVITSAADDLFTLLKKEDCHYIDSPDALKESSTELIESAKNLIRALESPGAFIKTYNLKK